MRRDAPRVGRTGMLPASRGIDAGDAVLLENDYESDGFGEEDLQQVQDRASQARRAGHLQRPAPQAAAGLIRARKMLDNALNRLI